MFASMAKVGEQWVASAPLPLKRTSDLDSPVIWSVGPGEILKILEWQDLSTGTFLRIRSTAADGWIERRNLFQPDGEAKVWPLPVARLSKQINASEALAPLNQHVLHRAAINKFFSSRFDMTCLKRLTWSFLWNPHSVVILTSEVTSEAQTKYSTKKISLQTGALSMHQTFQQSIDPRCICNALLQTSIEGLHVQNAGTALSTEPIGHGFNIVMDNMEQDNVPLVQRSLDVTGAFSNSTHISCADSQSLRHVLIQKTQGQVTFRSNCVAISSQHHWMGVVLNNLEVPATQSFLHIFDTQTGRLLAQPFAFSSYPSFLGQSLSNPAQIATKIAIFDDVLVVKCSQKDPGYLHPVYKLRVFQPDISGTHVDSSLESCELRGVTLPSSVGRFVVHDHTLAAVIKPCPGWSKHKGPSTWTRVDESTSPMAGIWVMRLTSNHGIEQSSMYRLSGIFHDVVVAPSVIVTSSPEMLRSKCSCCPDQDPSWASVLQVWSRAQPANCLLRFNFSSILCISLSASGTEPNLCVVEEALLRDEEVIEHIEYETSAEDFPAEIDRTEASIVNEELWIGSIERLLHRQTNSDQHALVADDATDSGRTCIVLLTFGRNPMLLEEAILASPPARTATDRGMNVKPDWAHGAKILAEGLGPENFEPPFILQDGLRPWHVVLHEEDEDALLSALNSLPYSIRKLRPGVGRSQLPNETELFDVSSDGLHTAYSDGLEDSSEVCSEQGHMIEIPVARTFIHFQIPMDSRSVRSV